MIIHCLNCREALELPEGAVGAKVSCPFCGEKFIGEEEVLILKPAASGISHPVSEMPCDAGARNPRVSEFLSVFEEGEDKGYCNCNLVDVLKRDDVIANLSHSHLPVILGLDDDGVRMCDLADPENDALTGNLIVAGRTGAGKSVFAKCAVAGLLLKATTEAEVYVWSVQGLDFNRRFLRAPGVTIFEGVEEFATALSIVGKLADFRAERVAADGCKSLAEYNVKHPEDALAHVLFVLDGCDYAAFKGADLLPLSRLLRKSIPSGVHLLAMGQGWTSDGKTVKAVAQLFGRKLCFGVWPDAIRGAFDCDKKFVKLASEQANGEAIYDDGFGSVTRLRTVNVTHQDFHRLGEWKAKNGIV